MSAKVRKISNKKFKKCENLVNSKKNRNFAIRERNLFKFACNPYGLRLSPVLVAENSQSVDIWLQK